MYYGQDPATAPADEDVFVQIQQVYDAAGNFITEMTDVIASDPEMEPMKPPPPPVVPKQPSTLQRIGRYLADANDDEKVTAGEAKVFGMGVLAGWIVSSLFRR